MSTTPASKSSGSPPPWGLESLVSHPLLRGIVIVFNWILLDRISTTSAFFQGFLSVCFSFLLLRCSRYINPPSVKWIANIGITIYLVGMAISFLGMAGWVITETTGNDTPILRISPEYRMCVQITNLLFGTSSMYLMYLWLPIILAAVFDWGFLKTYKEDSKIKNLDRE